MKGKLFAAAIGIILVMHVSDVMGQETKRIFAETYPLLRGIPNVVALKESVVGSAEFSVKPRNKKRKGQ